LASELENKNMYLLEEKIWFWLLLIIPVILVMYGLLVFWQKRTQKKFANPSLLRKLSPNSSIFKGKWELS